MICVFTSFSNCSIVMFQVLFSSYVMKTNRFNKPAERVLLISDLAIYKLDAHKFKTMRRGMPIQEVFLRAFFSDSFGILLAFFTCLEGIAGLYYSVKSCIGETVGT